VAIGPDIWELTQKGKPTGENRTYPDDVQPGSGGDDELAVAGKFTVRGESGPGLLGLLDDPQQLIEAAIARGHQLSVAEVLLAQMLADQRADVHRQRQALRTVGFTQSAAGYTKLVKPPGGLQYIKVATVIVSIDAAGTFRFAQGDSESTADGGVGGMGAMTLATGGVISLHAPNPERNPLFVTSPELTLGVVSGTGKVSGLISFLFSDDEQ